MNVTGTAPSSYFNTSPSTSTSTTGTGKSTLSEQDFLQLISTQLKNQDPLKPLDDSAYMAQMAQISTLHATTHLASDMSSVKAIQTNTTAASYLGRQVTLLDSKGATVVGPVMAVDTSGTDPQISVNGTLYPLADIQKIEPYTPP